jgi:hypothetical protein
MESMTLSLGVFFASMLILVWIIPGMVNRKGKSPEDFPPRKGGWHVPRSA